MKKFLTGLLVTALMLLVSNGFKEKEITIPIETGGFEYVRKNVSDSV